MTARALFAVGVLLVIASTDVAHAQRRVVVRIPPPVADPSPGTKLAPALRAAIAADARFIGTTRNGDPVLVVAAGQNRDDLIGAMKQIALDVSVDDITVAEVTPIDELIVLFDGKLPGDQKSVAGLVVDDRYEHGGWLTVRSAQGFSAKELQAIAEVPGIRFVEPNYRYWLLQGAGPNDPGVSKQWGMQTIGAPRVWATHNSSSVVVAVLDTGIDLQHEDLAANLWVNRRESRDGQDNDRNGFVDDIHGADFTARDGDPDDRHGHGTHVAGIIGGVGNNAKGVAGVNWSVELMAIRMVEPAAPDIDPGAPGSGIAAAIDHAVTNGAKVLNNSWGGGPFSLAISESIERANDAGALFIAAAGNTGEDNDARPVYPASYSHPNVITVAAVDSSDRLWSSSNFGRDSVDLAAPGVGVYSTVPNNRYGSDRGTSMAAPHVAGAIALVWSHPQFRTLAAAEIKTLILDHVRKVPGLTDRTVTGGVLDLSFVPGVPTTAPTPTPRVPSDPATIPAPGKPERVEVEGTVRTDYAIGGETTGWVLEIKGSTSKLPWPNVELSFTSDEQRQVARQAMKAGLPVIVTGDLRIVSGIERGKRLVLSVAKIDSKKND